MGHRFFFNFSVLVFSLRSVLVQLSYTRIIRGLARSLPKFVTGVTALSFIYSSFFSVGLDWELRGAVQRAAEKRHTDSDPSAHIPAAPVGCTTRAHYGGVVRYVPIIPAAGPLYIFPPC